MEARVYIGELAKFQPSQIVSTTATNPDALWTAGSYAVGARVTHQISMDKGFMKGLAVLRVFESQLAANTAKPGTDAAKWLDIGPANTVAMFDGQVSTSTTQAGTLTVKWAPGYTATVVALFGMVGQSITLTARDNLGEVMFAETRDLVAEEILDWFDYFHAPFDQLSRVVFFGVPVYTNSTLEVSITPRDGVAGIGQICVAMPRDVGSPPLSGASVGIDDYSVKETDEYGDTTFVERPSSKHQNLTVLTEKERLGNVFRLLDKLRATPCLLLATSDPDYAEAFVNYGWIGTSSVVAQHTTHSLLNIEFKGLT